ncbi:MAG: UDP-N-acetylmuramate--L-alanine ligase [Coriobacteriales bacterium]|jgi:UDP-N-acetylmuramate--alanine ligase|nr:UDP-N-acetylmuramate--L-alanine ligase [Coriobacteriales bacterium]
MRKFDQDPKVTSAYFIGIGGSGMAAIAYVARRRGIRVGGSDLHKTTYMEAILRDGVEVSFEQKADNIDAFKPQIVVVSTAIPRSNAEYARALELGLEIWPRAKMLGYLGRNDRVLAVSGTHGKTTTSAMLATSLVRLGADPTFLIGGVVDGFDSSARVGNGKDYVVEADESDGSFVYLDPDLAIITNIEADHLDHYENIEQIEFAFSAFLAKLSACGIAIVCADNPALPRLAKESARAYLTYGLEDGCDLQCLPQSDGSFLARYRNDNMTSRLKLAKSPGVHNMLNACAVLLALDWLGIDRAQAAQALSAYSGARRRFDKIGSVSGVDVVDDYGHHPTEIKATLAAARALGYSHIHALFQPHRYTRTQVFMEEFAAAFDDVDSVTLMNIYPAGEAPIEGVSSNVLFEHIQGRPGGPFVRLIDDRGDIPFAMAEIAEAGDLIITQGAGDVSALAPLILRALEVQ